MATKIQLIHPITKIQANGYLGFSWTYLFFGFWVPLFRGEILIGVLHAFISCITLGIWQIIMAFLYNKQYMVRMLNEKGYVLHDTPKKMNYAKFKLNITQ